MGGRKKDRRFVQANREALIALGAYALYFLWWYISAYGLGEGDPAEYHRIFGMPAWFFYSCIVGYPLISILLWGLIRFFFKDMPLDEEEEDEEGSSGAGDAEQKRVGEENR